MAAVQEPQRPSGRVDITAVIDRSRVGSLQVSVFVLCLCCLIMDGFDVQALGYTAPAIIADWGVASAALGPVFAAGNFGVLIGSLVFSMVADRLGRRPVLSRRRCSSALRPS